MNVSQSPRARTIRTVIVVALALGAVIMVWSNRRGTVTPADEQKETPAILPSGPLGAAAPRAKDACEPTHCGGAACDACTTANCIPTRDGCDRIAELSERNLCERIYACFNEPTNACVTQGDSLKCWCGTNPTTCVTSNTPPTQANGKCRDLVFEGARSTDAATIRHRFVDAAFPLGRAVNLTLCRGTFCAAECKIH